MKPIQAARPNPFRDPSLAPDWAQLTRLGGDRVALLFEDLRARLGKIGGIQEELRYHGPEWGWGPHYRLGGASLCAVRALPGRLEAVIEVEPASLPKLLGSPSLGAGVRSIVAQLFASGSPWQAPIVLSNRTTVRDFARLVVLKSKAVEVSRARRRRPDGTGL